MYDFEAEEYQDKAGYSTGISLNMGNDTTVRVPIWQPIFTIVFITGFALLTLLIAGDWKWVEGWVFVLLFWSFSLVTSARMYFKDPALFRERFSSPVQRNQKAWDKIVIFLIIATYLVWFVIAPLDARRFRWSPDIPIWIKILGAVMTAAGLWLFYATFKENTFAAPVVKIQTERKQHVISTGVYSIVRHPLYLGACLQVLGGSLLLGSMFGLIAGLVFVAVIAIRSVGEEEMLRNELEGYEEYRQRVRSRIVPYIF